VPVNGFLALALNRKRDSEVRGSLTRRPGHIHFINFGQYFGLDEVFD
jgi:hypothetical protein